MQFSEGYRQSLRRLFQRRSRQRCQFPLTVRAVTRGSYVALVGWMVLATAAHSQATTQEPDCPSGADQSPLLRPLEAQSGRLATGEVSCFRLLLQEGEFVRISVTINTGFVRAQVLEPREHHPLVVASVWPVPHSPYFPQVPMAFEAPSSGSYIIKLDVPRGWRPVPSFTIQVEEYLSASTRAALREELANDPRTAWLRGNALRIRSMSPEDQDFSDLEPLRAQLRGVRVVLLGEADHGDGSDLSAKTRLVEFLHRRMGFDVLAFESGLFGTSTTWRAMETGNEPLDAFRRYVWRAWGRSEQLEPLVRYLGASARTGQPLELSGFDLQFQEEAEARAFLSSLRQFIVRIRIASVLADSASTQSQILAGVLEGRFMRDPRQLPQLADQVALIESLRGAAALVERTDVPRREKTLWMQLLRSTSVHAELTLNYMRNGDFAAAYAGREHQLVDNLMWLLNVYCRGRKIIVWAHTGHVMRAPQEPALGGASGFRMGQGVWEALGKESFAIGFVSYTGSALFRFQEDGQRTIVSDQHPAFEFEELMEAAGHDLAFVNLRRVAPGGEWLRAPFLARPLMYTTERARWSDVLDGLFFIRTQEANRQSRAALR
jgi:erythromycin esterase